MSIFLNHSAKETAGSSIVPIVQAVIYSSISTALTYAPPEVLPAVKETCHKIWFERESGLIPHSFRHRFLPRIFLEKFNDISLLADLMGHESIETTRIYLRRSSAEQQEIVDKVITW